MTFPRIVLFGLALLFLSRLTPGAETISPEEFELVKQAEEARINTIQRVYGSVVAVYGPARQGGGSGVLFDEAGYALTNHHVVAAAGVRGQAGLADGKLYPWKLIGTDPGGDVAIIKLEGKEKFPTSPLGRSDEVRVGDWAMAMGNPFVLAEDHTPTVTLGIVSGVKRYQYGAGSNTLVYGNCIQVDSSINPGNSGGPLYNMHGQVIGINGRGSFKERGRVNVGVGYAISMRQIRNFIPELMATKMAQHGTLDALFSDRRDADGNQVVLCSTLNLDAPVARLGLQLGDRLVAFEGHDIYDANEFTNLISTLPAGWPAELTYERNGVQNTIWVRLTALPYGQKQIHPPQEDEEPKEEGEDEPDGGPRRIQIGRAKPNFGQEGEIRDKELNRENAKYLLRRWRHFSGAENLGDEVAGFVLHDDLLRKDKRIGEVKTTISRDGKFRVAYTEYGVEYAFGHDGNVYWAHLPDRAPQQVELAELLEQPIASQAIALAELLRENPLQHWGHVRIDGSDKSQRSPSFRLRASDGDAPLWFVWLRQFNDQGQTHIELSKTGTDVDGADPGIVYSDWKEVSGLALPHTRSIAVGLDEASVVYLQTANVEATDKFNEDEFRSPADAE